MKKILLIDNTFDPPHGCPEIRSNLEQAAAGVGGMNITFVRAPDCQIPLDLSPYDGVVLSGSKTRILETAPWIEKEMDAIRKLYDLKIPTFGICYGEQLIARTLGGEKVAGVAKNEEYGWVEIDQHASSSLLEGLPEKFYSFAFHSDEVRELPKGFRLTASSATCPVQAYDVEGAPIWGVQFHPERSLKESACGLERRLKSHPECKLVNSDKGDQLFSPVVGATIFRNFVRLVQAGR